MIDTPEVQKARMNAEQARYRMTSLVQELQQRLAPKTLASNAWQEAKSKGADIAEDAVDAVRKRPIAATGAVAAIAMFLAREPLMDLAGRLWNGKADSPAKRKGKSKRESLEGSKETMEALK